MRRGRITPRAADVMRVKEQQCQKQRTAPTADAMRAGAISAGWRARRCESRRVSVPRGLCKRLGSASDPRAVPEERSPEGSSASEEREDTERLHGKQPGGSVGEREEQRGKGAEVI